MGAIAMRRTDRDQTGRPPLAKKFLSEMQDTETRKPYAGGRFLNRQNS